MEEGLETFLRFAEGCRCYLQDKDLISREDSEKIAMGKADMETLKRVFYVALPGLEKTAKLKGLPLFHPEVLLEYYCFEHNRLKISQGELACIAYPAKVLEKEGSDYLLELEPVRGKFWVSSDLGLKENGWVLLHRINIVQQIPKSFALELVEYLQKQGLGKSYKFPKKAIEYLRNLQRIGGGVYGGKRSGSDCHA